MKKVRVCRVRGPRESCEEKELLLLCKGMIEEPGDYASMYQYGDEERKGSLLRFGSVY